MNGIAETAEAEVGGRSPSVPASGVLIGLWGIFGTRNFGNECSLHAMIESARRHAPGSRFLVICSQPADTRVRHGVEAEPITLDPESGLIRTQRQKGSRLSRLWREIGDWRRVMRTVRRLDHLMMPGTGLLTDSHESVLGTPYQMLKWTLAAHLCGKPVSFVSVGAETLAHPVKSRFIASALRLARYRSYRDRHSRDRAARLVEAAGTDPVYPDLAFSLPRSLLVPGRGSPRAVAVGIYALEGDAEAIARYVETIGRFLVHLLERDYQPRIVYGDAEYDEAVCRQLLTWVELHGLRERVIYEYADSFETLMAQIAGCDMMIATRFHNVLLGLLLGKPVFSVSHMDKNDQLMEMMGLTEFTLPLAQATTESLIACFARLEAERDTLWVRIEERAAQFRDQLEAQYSLLFGSALGAQPAGVVAA